MPDDNDDDSNMQAPPPAANEEQEADGNADSRRGDSRLLDGVSPSAIEGLLPIMLPTLTNAQVDGIQARVTKEQLGRRQLPILSDFEALLPTVFPTLTDAQVDGIQAGVDQEQHRREAAAAAAAAAGTDDVQVGMAQAAADAASGEAASEAANNVQVDMALVLQQEQRERDSDKGKAAAAADEEEEEDKSNKSDENEKFLRRIQGGLTSVKELLKPISGGGTAGLVAAGNQEQADNEDDEVAAKDTVDNSDGAKKPAAVNVEKMSPPILYIREREPFLQAQFGNENVFPQIQENWNALSSAEKHFYITKNLVDNEGKDWEAFTVAEKQHYIDRAQRLMEQKANSSGTQKPIQAQAAEKDKNDGTMTSSANTSESSTSLRSNKKRPPPSSASTASVSANTAAAAASSTAVSQDAQGHGSTAATSQGRATTNNNSNDGGDKEEQASSRQQQESSTNKKRRVANNPAGEPRAMSRQETRDGEREEDAAPQAGAQEDNGGEAGAGVPQGNGVCGRQEPPPAPQEENTGVGNNGYLADGADDHVPAAPVAPVAAAPAPVADGDEGQSDEEDGNGENGGTGGDEDVGVSPFPNANGQQGGRQHEDEHSPPARRQTRAMSRKATRNSRASVTNEEFADDDDSFGMHDQGSGEEEEDDNGDESAGDGSSTNGGEEESFLGDDDDEVAVDETANDGEAGAGAPQDDGGDNNVEEDAAVAQAAREGEGADEQKYRLECPFGCGFCPTFKHTTLIGSRLKGMTVNDIKWLKDDPTCVDPSQLPFGPFKSRIQGWQDMKKHIKEVHPGGPVPAFYQNDDIRPISELRSRQAARGNR